MTNPVAHPCAHNLLDRFAQLWAGLSPSIFDHTCSWFDIIKENAIKEDAARCIVLSNIPWNATHHAFFERFFAACNWVDILQPLYERARSCNEYVPNILRFAQHTVVGQQALEHLDCHARNAIDPTWIQALQSRSEVPTDCHLFDTVDTVKLDNALAYDMAWWHVFCSRTDRALGFGLADVWMWKGLRFSHPYTVHLNSDIPRQAYPTLRHQAVAQGQWAQQMMADNQDAALFDILQHPYTLFQFLNHSNNALLRSVVQRNTQWLAWRDRCGNSIAQIFMAWMVPSKSLFQWMAKTHFDWLTHSNNIGSTVRDILDKELDAELLTVFDQVLLSNTTKGSGKRGKAKKL